MSFSSVSCIVCHSEANSLCFSPCMKGHQQCHNCVSRLDGFCGICSAPIIVESDFDRKDAVDEEVLLAASRSCGDGVQTNLGFGAMYQDASQPSTFSSKYETEALLDAQYEIDAESYYESIMYDDEISKTDNISESLMEMLRYLHEHKCSKTCTTFEYCIRQLLLEQFGDGPESHCMSATDINRSSLSDVLDSIHASTCDFECENKDRCLSSTLRRMVKKNVSRTEEESQSNLLYIKESFLSSGCRSLESNVEEKSSTFVDNESNVVRAFCTQDNDFSQPQFKFITTFPSRSDSLPRDLDFGLPFSFESNRETARTLKCPLQECDSFVEDCHLISHFMENHRRYPLLLLQLNECRLFFIDLSLLEKNEISCVTSYKIPNIFKLPNKTDSDNLSLPVFVMACRANLSTLTSASKGNQTKDIKKCVRTKEDIDAEVLETVYGLNKPLKKEPVNWALDDVLIIYPVAPIPLEKALRTTLAVFTPQNPKSNMSSSFCMRSLRKSIAIRDLIGSPDVVCLTSVDIAALTCDGQYVVHCQIMCK